MITIELLGGARKSFPDGAPQISGDTIGLDEALRRVCAAVPKGAAPLDLKNSLVALNGIDSSALREASVHDGDTITIIPIVHGGQGTRVTSEVLVASLGRGVRADSALVDSLRAEFPRIAIQLLRRKFVLGQSHARRIAGVSIAAARRGSLLAKRMETDMLMRFANTHQISQAISLVGARRGEGAVLVAVGSRFQLDRLESHARPLLKNPVGYGSEQALRRELGITSMHMRAVYSRHALEDILVERAAVLL